MDKPETKEALKELLEILVEHPELAERITITIKLYAGCQSGWLRWQNRAV